MKSIFQLILVVSFLLISDVTFANNCITAEVITSIPYSYIGTTVGAGNNYGSGDACNNVHMTGEDFVFTYTSPGNEVLSVELNNLNDDWHGLFVLDGCPDDPLATCLNTETTGGSNTITAETVHLILPGQYYIVVSSRGGFTPSFDFELTVTNSIGNICANAVNVPNVPFTYTGTTSGAGNDYGSNDVCANVHMTGNDFVFQYTSPGNEVLGIQLDNLNDDWHGLFVLDGCPDDPLATCMYSGITGGSDSIFIETVHFINPGLYYFVVSSRGGFTPSFDFELNVTNTIGNICENALSIPSVPYSYSGTTISSGNDYGSNDACSNVHMTGNDFVFQYTSPGNEVLGIQLDNLNDDWHGLFVLDGCPDDPLATCMYSGITGGSDSIFLETVHLINPGLYYFVVSSRGGFTQVFDFDFTITTPVGNICENARPISGLPYTFTGTTRATGSDYGSTDACASTHMTGNDHLFEYTPNANEYLDLTLTNLNDDWHGLFIIEGCPNDPAAFCYAFGTQGGSAPIILTTSACLTAGSTYYIVVSSRGAFTNWFDFTLDINQNLQTTISATESSGLTNDNYLCDNEAGTAIVNFAASATGGNGGGYSFLWDNAAASTTAGISETPITTTTYTVTATDSGGCSVVESYTIEVDPPLLADIVTTENSGIVNDDIICASTSGTTLYTLDAIGSSGGFGTLSYAWNTSDITPVINEMPIATTTYTLTITDDHNCSESMSQQVIINPALSVVLTGTENSGAIDDLVICGSDAGSESAILTASPTGGTSGYTYDWSPQNGASATLTTSPNVTTNYVVTLTDSNGCDAIDNITVEVVNASCVWIGPTNMNWYDNPNFWSLGRFPTVCDHVVIPSGKFVTLRNGFHGWGNTLEVDGELDARPGSKLDIVTEY